MYSAIAANKRKSILIMGLFVAILGALGWVASNIYAEPSFLYLALVGGGVYALIQYFAASKMALAINGAREVTKRDEPRLYRIVENLAITTGLPTPKVYVMDDPALNAFATGRDPKHAAVCATTGLLAALNDSQLEAVMAHEMGHVQNYDIRVSMIAFGLVAAIGMVADLMMHMIWFSDNRERNVSPLFIVLGLVAAILAPIVALMVQMAVSRRREYLADSTGALTTRHPDALAEALELIHQQGAALRQQNTATAHLFFANPLKGNSIAKLFSTHPPVQDRIARLRGMADKL